MKYKLFLDDIREPKDVYSYITNKIYASDDWLVVRNYQEFIDIINSKYDLFGHFPEIISFDHDLADEHYRPSMFNPDEHYGEYYDDGTFKEKTGYECAKWLVEFCIDNNLKMPKYYVHSMNPVGGKNILCYLDNYVKIIENHE